MGEIPQELLDELLAGYEKPEDLVGPDGLLKQLFGRLVETAAGAELTDHLGYEKGDVVGRGSGNSRNGMSPKTLLWVSPQSVETSTMRRCHVRDTT